MFGKKKKVVTPLEDSLPGHVKWIYGIGELGQQFSQMMMTMFMLFFFTNVLGISAAAAGTLFLIARIWDAINDPIMGMIIDRTNHKMGKCRPYIMWFAVPAGFFLFMCFYAPDLSPTMKLVWAYVAYIGQSMAYTATGLSYTMLISRAARSSQDRVGMNSKRVIMCSITGIIVSGATLQLVELFGNGDMQKGFAITAAIYGSITALSYFIVVWIMKPYDKPDPVTANKLDAPTSNALDDLKLILKNPIWCLSVSGDLCYITAVTVSSSSMLYYTTYVLKNDAAFTALAPLSIFASMIAGMTVTFLSKRFKKSSIAACGMFVGGFATMSRLITGDENFTVMVIIAAAAGMAIGYSASLLVPILMDAIVYNQCIYGKRMDGLTISTKTFSYKLALGLGGALTGFYLEFSGFVEGAETQTAGALGAITNCCLFIPGALYLISGTLLLIYGRYEKKIPDMIADAVAKAKEAAAAATVSANVEE